MIQVSAKVVDVITGQGIPNATISVNGKAIGKADVSGDFTVMINTYADNITASSVGYTSLTQAADSVQEAGTMELQLDVQDLDAVTVTAPKKKTISPWWILAGVAVIGSQGKPSRRVSGKDSSNLLPLALVGIGAYALLRPQTTYLPTPIYQPGQPSQPAVTPGNGSILTPGGITDIFDLIKGLFKGENTPAGTYTSYDPYPTPGTGMAGTGTFNAGDIIDHTLIAAMKVPIYSTPKDNASPTGYINQGNPIGIVYSYLEPNPAAGRSVLWWQFQGSNGSYFVPHNPDYFDTQALIDAGVLSVAQATALKNGTAPGTVEKLLDKYIPWIIGGLVAVGVGKAIINKVI